MTLPYVEPLMASSANASAAYTSLYYLADVRGSVIGLTNDAGTISARYHYDEFGSMKDSYKLDLNYAGPDNLFGYTGLAYDYASDLSYARARYFDSGVGRFINEDTYEGELNNPLTLNLYTYVLNNPLRYIDPTGNYCQSADGKYSQYGGCNGGEKGVNNFFDTNGSLYIPDSYMNQKQYSWATGFFGKSFDQLYVKYHMELLSQSLARDIEKQQALKNQQMIDFMDDITGVSSIRTLTDPNSSADEILITLATLTLPGVKGKPGKPLKTQKAGKTLRLTNIQAGDLAKYLGFTPVKGVRSRTDQPIYTNGKIFISPDLDSHVGGVWKAGKTVEDLNSKNNRYGTYDALLNYLDK